MRDANRKAMFAKKNASHYRDSHKSSSLQSEVKRLKKENKDWEIRAFGYGMKKEIEALTDDYVSQKDFQDFMENEYFEHVADSIKEAWETFKERKEEEGDEE